MMQPLNVGDYTLCDIAVIARKENCANRLYLHCADWIQESVALEAAQSCYAQGLTAPGDKIWLDCLPAGYDAERDGDPDERHAGGGFLTPEGWTFATRREAWAYHSRVQKDLAEGRRWPPCFIYFIQATDTRPLLIKIGSAKEPLQRLALLQIGSSHRLRIIALMPGDRADESALHAEFADHRVRGEWFQTSPALRARIDEINRKHGHWIDNIWLFRGGLRHRYGAPGALKLP